MSKFRKNKDTSPAISTASLPDIVFMLLFFFMVTTVMREEELKVKINPPEATEVKKLENRSLVCYVYIGRPNDLKKYGDSPRLQLNDAFEPIQEVGAFIEKKRSELDEVLIPKLTTSLKVDQDVEMGIVTEVKQELRKVQALKISYSTMEKYERE